MPRANVKDRRQQQLIQATIDSIAKRGLTETSITHISKGAGMSRGIINFYFKSKELMMQGTLQTLVDEYEAILQEALNAAEKDAKSQLLALVDAHFHKKLCQQKRLNVLSAFWGHAATHEAYRTIIDTSDIKLQERIVALWSELQPDGFNPQQFSRQLHALIRGLWLSFLMAPDSSREQLAKECHDFVDQHLQPLRVVTDNAPVLVEKPKAKPVRPAKAEESPAMQDLFASLA